MFKQKDTTNGTILIPLSDNSIREVKPRMLVNGATMAIVPIMVERDSTPSQYAKRELLGQSNTKKAYRLTHVPTGKRIADFKTLKAAKHFAELYADRLDWTQTEWPKAERIAAGEFYIKYKNQNNREFSYNKIYCEFPTAVNNT